MTASSLPARIPWRFHRESMRLKCTVLLGRRCMALSAAPCWGRSPEICQTWTRTPIHGWCRKKLLLTACESFRIAAFLADEAVGLRYLALREIGPIRIA